MSVEMDIVKFAKDVLGIELLPYQEEILRRLKRGGRVFIVPIRGSLQEIYESGATVEKIWEKYRRRFKELDAWDELWTRDVSPEEREEWLHEVKAEGDQIKSRYHGAVTKEQLSNIVTNTNLYMMRESDPIKNLKYRVLNTFALYAYNNPEGERGFDWDTIDDDEIREQIRKLKGFKTDVTIFPEYTWRTSAQEVAEDLKFSCECGKQVECKEVFVGDEVECECGIKYELDTATFLKKVVEEGS